jgi:predicted secreted protein
LTGIQLAEVSIVDVPANEGSRHLMYKNTAAIGDPPEEGADPGQDADADPGETEEIASLRRQIAASEAARAESEAARAETETALAALTERLLAATPAPAAPAAPEPPAQTPWQREDAELGGLAILAAETPEKGSREFWRRQVDALGRHLAPDLPPTHQVARALDDPRGRAFVAALQSRPA